MHKEADGDPGASARSCAAHNFLDAGSPRVRQSGEVGANLLTRGGGHTPKPRWVATASGPFEIRVAERYKADTDKLKPNDTFVVIGQIATAGSETNPRMVFQVD